MKTQRVASCLMVICLVVAVGGLFAQTKAPAQKAPAAPAASAAPASFDPALLQPATLTETAPDVYDVKFTTTKGDFVVRVTRAWAPLGADRFYNLVKHGFYDGAALFRVVPGFVVQFGISAHPQVSWVWLNATIKDDPVKKSNRRGYVTFATGGANTRTTQVFINLGDNSGLDATGFSPFGQVTEGMKVVEQLYSGYGEGVTDKQGQIASQGNAYLEKAYPKLDKIISATLVTPPEAPANAPAKKAP